MEPDDVVKRIEEVDIQGATAVAEQALRLLKQMEEEGRNEEDIRAVQEGLEAARPTEPLLFNALAVGAEAGYDAALDHIKTAQDTIADRAASLIGEGDMVYTHCHSSTVTAVLQAAVDAVASVRVTETRPLYQGRTTAEELAAAGLPVTLYVDSAMQEVLRDSDRMLLGADAITADGSAINKIGSGLAAETASRLGVPVHIAAEGWKFAGDDIEMEERPPREVWEDAPGDVDIANPAFERVRPELIDGIVSELGVHEPNEFMDAVGDEYPELV